ncbi:hypothetical protein [Streptomyces sp. NPDC058612]|uniref:DUF6197 family protein n=1 Tax=Streptomyces sp. NPDC058612 TaxID=3346555 RepID=UPI00365532D6
MSDLIARLPLPVRPVPAGPHTVEAVVLAAARTIQTNGHWQGEDYVPAIDREATVPQSMLPMSILGALRCAAGGDPTTCSVLADEATARLAVTIAEPPYGDIFTLEAVVEEWGAVPGRSGDEVVALLELVATTSVRAA